MNAWLWAATALFVALVPCLTVMMRGDAVSRLVGLELAGTVDTLLLLLLAIGFNRTIYAVLAIVTAFLALAGGLVFARFLERWL